MKKASNINKHKTEIIAYSKYIIELLQGQTLSEFLQLSQQEQQQQLLLIEEYNALKEPKDDDNYSYDLEDERYVCVCVCVFVYVMCVCI